MKKLVVVFILLMLLGSLYPFAHPQLSSSLTMTAFAQDDLACAVTHYPELGGCEADPGKLKATYAVYNSRETDPVEVLGDIVSEVLTALNEETGLTFVLVNDWAMVASGAEAVQIVNNVPIEGALYTFFLPQGWTATGSYPVALSGNGAGQSNNQRLYMDREFTLPQLVAQSTEDGSGGMIGVLSNAGGTESLGIDDISYQSVGAFFAFVTGQAGGDAERLVIAGASRGGGAALMWSINPLGLNYNIKATFADIPPTAYGTFTQRSIMTYPSLGGINVLVLGNPFAWVYGREDGPGTEYSKALEFIIGTGLPDEADGLSPMGMADKLAGKDILIAHGTHDSFFALRVFLKFDRTLNELDIEHGTYITLGQGHTYTVPLWAEFRAYMLALAKGEDHTLPTGRQIWIDTQPAGDSEADMPLNDYLVSIGQDPLPADEVPFTVEFPWKTGATLPIDISVCGATGADFSAIWTTPDGQTEEILGGTLDDTECAWVQVPAPQLVGDYVWSFTYRGEPINPLNTLMRDELGCAIQPAITTVLEQQPFIRDNYAFDFTMAWGLDQFAAQSSECMVQ